MGLAEWFSDFNSNLKVQDGGTISTRYKNITKRLNTDFWNTTSDASNSLYVGSYGRRTATEGFSDLDMIFRLPYSEYEKYNNYSGNGQSALLQTVKLHRTTIPVIVSPELQICKSNPHWPYFKIVFFDIQQIQL